MEKDRNSYMNIIKATSLFGGIKIFQIIIQIIRSKFIAILLGPTGMGIAGLITSTTDLINTITGFGLRTSGVRDVSQAYTSGDDNRQNITITVLRKLVLLTGILGTVLTFLFSSYLSEWAFNTRDYSLAFKIVSIILFFNQINIGQIVLLQGTFHYKYIAKSTFYSNIIILVFTIPIYYLWGIHGIVPAIIISSLIPLVLTWFYTKKIPYKKIDLSLNQLFSKGKAMLILGLAIALSGFSAQAKDYILKIYISNIGGISDVGLYASGIAIATTYVGMVLSAMSSDYAPRLASVANNETKLVNTINKQILLLVLLLAPLIISFIVFIKHVIILLYSSKFIEITGMIEWVMIGMFFRAISWSISFSFIARGDTKIFLFNEIFTKLYSLGLSFIGYYLNGLTGLGIAFFLTYIIYTVHMYIIAKKRYRFFFSSESYKVCIPIIIISLLFSFILKVLDFNIYRYISGCLFIIVISGISFYNLNKIVNVKLLLNEIKNKIIKK